MENMLRLLASTFNRRGIAPLAKTMLMVSALSACVSSPPAMGSHLPGSSSEASNAFDQRVKARFPVGSDETTLRAELAREKFVIVREKDAPFGFSASYRANELVCRADWVIHWSVFEGKIAAVGGQFGETCL
jgi:hypothetical protein